MTSPYSFSLDTLPLVEGRTPPITGHSPSFLYRYWADGEAEWIFSSGIERVPKSDPWKDIETLETLAKKEGGLCVGYLAYELGAAECLGRMPKKVPGIPLIHLGYYGKTPQKILSPRRAILTLEPQQDFAFYQAAIQNIKSYLEAGDVYQVNYTQLFSEKTTCSAREIAKRLNLGNPAPYAAFIDCGDFEILSSSPELFLKIEGDRIETHPIKGTIVRGKTDKEDAEQKRRLLESEKDAAELLMICDLERNDLGRIAEVGSVVVDGLREIQTFPTLHHLVSRVSGRLKKGLSHTEALRACFPGGSITGAPKKRAIEIIEELEPHARGVYTGAIGYMGHKTPKSPFESMWNIAIRTLVHQAGHVVFGSGGGITIDSDPRLEYEESLLKAKALKAAIGSGRSTPCPS